MPGLWQKEESIDLCLQLPQFRGGLLYQLFQVIRVLELIKGGKLFIEPLKSHRLGVFSGRRLSQSLDFGCRHGPAKRGGERLDGTEGRRSIG